ncbi:carbonic anhydrase [Mesoterricola sediminis]|uniref:Carbonic anhydrase n=1 Tax=Mesoterricola sediminis TaxID=2927980 RepID=A0AA48KC57_9BACT|nr:carbonic anhydrase [Mesoterricola sediminis]BDU75740.1 hypothetical protein METESE_06980 [Mesoterricola sediminis]
MRRLTPLMVCFIALASAMAQSPQKSAAQTRLRALELEAAGLRRTLLGAAQSPDGPEAASPAGALLALQEGNERFVRGLRIRSQMGALDPGAREALAKGQAPFAVIITCSDSRLADNFIFDQELGRLFTIREAGNAPDLQGLASAEYAVEHLGSRIIVVLGHESCGAVKAVQEAGPTPLPGNLWSLQAAMAGLLDSVPRGGESAGAHLSHLVEANARRQAESVLARSPLLLERCAKGSLSVVPAVYDLATGKVRFLPAVVPGHGEKTGGHS